MVDIIEEFVNKVLSKSCALAKHRNSEKLEVRDVKYVLEKEEGIEFPMNDPPEKSQKKLRRNLKNYAKRLQNIQKQLRKLNKDKLNNAGKE